VPIDVTAFTNMARAEFAQGKLAADNKPYPAAIEKFTTKMPSEVRVETHTYMSNLPRLREFKGWSPETALVSTPYTVANKEYRAGPVRVRKTDLDDNRTGDYYRSIQALPQAAQKDVQYMMLDFLAAGSSTACFDGTNFFANSHTIGTGDNLDTANFASNDGVTHKVIGLVVDNPVIKPILFQDREPLSELKTDANTPQADLVKEYRYWADTRFGLGYGFWWDAYEVTITDTPTVAECYTLIEQIVNGFRSFKLPKGNDVDSDLYVHEGWDPNPDNFVLLCNLKLGQILRRALSISQYVAATGNVDNVYQNVATLIPSSALGA
jgi:phage major head subunit gpT-like protein